MKGHGWKRSWTRLHFEVHFRVRVIPSPHFTSSPPTTQLVEDLEGLALPRHGELELLWAKG